MKCKCQYVQRTTLLLRAWSIWSIVTGDCTTGRCTCKTNNVACTDASGCQNTDAPPPAGEFNADDHDKLLEPDCSQEELEELQNFLNEIEEEYCDEIA